MISLLYVDDEPDLLDLCKIFLERSGEFSVDTTVSAEEGLKRLANGTIDAIVSDYQMPDMDGIEFLKRVRTEYKEIPFILFTGRGREEVVIQAINNGVDFYLQKGGDPKAQFMELSHKIRHAVRRRKAEDDLRAAYEKNQGLMDYANDAIIISDVDTGMLIDANKKAQDMIGKTREEIRSMRQADLHPKEDADIYEGYFRKHAREGKGVQEEIIVDREGTRIPVIVSATVLEIGGKRCIMEIFHDITDIKKAQEALQLANKKLNLMSEITRHDIRNKLTVLGGYLEMFTDHPPEPQHSMYLAKLQDTVATIRTNIEFTRLYQDLGVVAPEWKDVYDLFFLACTRVDLKKIRVHSDIRGLEVFADPLLERVFYNLVDNAVRHGNRVSEIRLQAIRHPEELIIRIEDNGTGIVPQDKEKVFSKGYGRNTGLGLFLAREILSITGMSIFETGQYQNGSCFEIHVPKGGFRYVKEVPVHA